MRALLALLLTFGAVDAAAAPDPVCMAACNRTPAAPYPACVTCDADHRGCEDLRTEGAAYDACRAKLNACYQELATCTMALQAGENACPADANQAACCVKTCTGDLSPTHESTSAWVYVDGFMAGTLRHDATDLHLRGTLGGEVAMLFGASRWKGLGLPFRIGPFVEAGAVVGGDDVGAQFGGGVESLVFGRSAEPSNGNFGVGVLVAAGVLDDRPGDAADRLGGLARVSLGVSTTGASPYKPVSVWFFLEGHWIPSSGADPARQEVLLGLRAGPLAVIMLLIPGAGDP